VPFRNMVACQGLATSRYFGLELLHLDVTIIRLLNGTRAYLHAAIDNYSRRILSWSLEDRLGSGGTCRLLREAAHQLRGRAVGTTVVADSGCENVRLRTRCTSAEAMRSSSSSPPHGSELGRSGSWRTQTRRVECAARTSIRQRCSCNALGPGCPETQRGWVLRAGPSPR
jgi:hypothetical protein